MNTAHYQNEQLSLLNTFDGKEPPSRFLLGLAKSMISYDESLERSPVRQYVSAANQADWAKFDDEQSGYEKAATLAGMFFRSTAGFALLAPTYLASHQTRDLFTRLAIERYDGVAIVGAEDPADQGFVVPTIQLAHEMIEQFGQKTAK